MALLYTSHGLVWKSRGCSGSGEHDPFASEIVELALRIERSAQRGAHRAFDQFEQWRCEACSWNCNALYTQWTATASSGDVFQPLQVIDAHEQLHVRIKDGLEQPLPEALDIQNRAASIRLEANQRIAERLSHWQGQGLLTGNVEQRYQMELTEPASVPV